MHFISNLDLHACSHVPLSCVPRKMACSSTSWNYSWKWEKELLLGMKMMGTTEEWCCASDYTGKHEEIIIIHSQAEKEEGNKTLAPCNHFSLFLSERRQDNFFAWYETFACITFSYMLYQYNLNTLQGFCRVYKTSNYVACERSWCWWWKWLGAGAMEYDEADDDDAILQVENVENKRKSYNLISLIIIPFRRSGERLVTNEIRLRRNHNILLFSRLTSTTQKRLRGKGTETHTTVPEPPTTYNNNQKEGYACTQIGAYTQSPLLLLSWSSLESKQLEDLDRSTFLSQAMACAWVHINWQQRGRETTRIAQPISRRVNGCVCVEKYALLVQHSHY